MVGAERGGPVVGGGVGRRALAPNDLADAPLGARGRGDAGQATVEVALVAPVVALLLLLVVQVGVLVRDQVMVVGAAREAARAAAVTLDDHAPEQAALASGSLRRDRFEATVHRDAPGSSGPMVSVEVRYRAETAVPVIGSLLPDVMLTARAAMRPET